MFKFIGDNGLSNVVLQILQHVILDMPGLAFFTTYVLLVLFWAEIYYHVLNRICVRKFLVMFRRWRCTY
jgi:hypothetical protein